MKSRRPLSKSMAGRLRSKQWVSFVFVLSAAFLVLAPLSGRHDASAFAYGVKWLRILVTVVLVFAVSRSERREPLGRFSKSLVCFAIFYSVSALWSNSPWLGLLNKSMFFFACLAGVFSVRAVRSFGELKWGMRIVGWTAIGSAAVVFYLYWTVPTEAVVLDRLAVADLNANNLGQSAAIFALFVVLFLVNAKDVRDRLIATIGLGLLLWVVIGTGSRGALLLLVVGSVCVWLPTSGRSFGGILIILMVPIITFYFLGFGESGKRRIGVWRFTSEEMLRNTREDHWDGIIETYYQPGSLFGIGWYNHGGRVASTANAYLQVLIETGFIGIIWFVLLWLWLLRRCFNLVRRRVSLGDDATVFTWFALGSMMALSLHACAESSILFGATGNPYLLGMAVGLLDRIPQLARKGGSKRHVKSRRMAARFQRSRAKDEAGGFV